MKVFVLLQLWVVCLFGKQIQQLKGAQVVVATPGRLLT